MLIMVENFQLKASMIYGNDLDLMNSLQKIMVYQGIGMLTWHQDF